MNEMKDPQRNKRRSNIDLKKQTQKLWKSGNKRI